jgi:hypothetical protein
MERLTPNRWATSPSSFVAGHKGFTLRVRLDPDGAATVPLVAWCARREGAKPEVALG